MPYVIAQREVQEDEKFIKNLGNTLRAHGDLQPLSRTSLTH